MQPKTSVKVDSFMLPGYNPPGAMPAEVATENQIPQAEYKIPPVVWMVVFLVAGYIGVRMMLDDGLEG